MNKNKLFLAGLAAVALVSVGILQSIAAVTPPSVEAILAPGESIVVVKTVDTPALPPVLDVCLLEDETGSFWNDIIHLQATGTAEAIYNDIVDESPGAHFAVTGFRDYDQVPYGSPGDYVYRLISSMSSDSSDWTDGIAALVAGGGNDTPEAQYDAIVAAASMTDGCGWRDDPTVTRVLVVTTDAPFHLPGAGKPHINTQALTTAALNAQGITVIGLKAPGAGGELDALAAATGGSVQPLSSDGSNIAEAILDGLSNLPTTVTPVPVGCAPLVVTFDPTSKTVTSGDQATFTETIAVPSDPSLAGATYTCFVEFRDNGTVLETQDITIKVPIAIDLNPETAVNELGTPGQTHTVVASVTSISVVIPDTMVKFQVVSGPNDGKSYSEYTNSSGKAEFTYVAEQGIAGLGMDVIEACVSGKDGEIVCDSATKEWVDTTAPEVECVEAVNPHGKKIPPAGKTTLPGSKGGQNEDGFYQLLAEDTVDPDPQIFVTDAGSGMVFGPFSSGTVIKYTEAPGAEPSKKKIGSDKGQAGSVAWHIIGNGDMCVSAVDFSGNESGCTSCLVPPMPK